MQVCIYLTNLCSKFLFRKKYEIFIFLIVIELTQALKTVVKYNGVKGLWMGLSATLLRDVPFSAIYWFNYEGIKRMAPSSTSQTFTFNFVAGAIAGSVSLISKKTTICNLNIDYQFIIIFIDSSLYYYSI